MNTIVYGSDTHGLTYINIDLNAEDVAAKIADKLNLSQHKFRQRLTVNEERNEYNIWLPYSVQLHRGTTKEQSLYYIVNAGELFCCDSILTNDIEYAPKTLTRRMRPEWMINNNYDQIADGYIKQTWRSPTRCWACGHFIQEFEFYFFEKRNLDKKRTVISQLFWCPEWYFDIVTEINTGVSEVNSVANKYPWHKFEKKELPHNKRGEFWMNEATGSVVTSPPLKKVSLNPDACLNSFGIESSEEDVGAIIKSRRKMLDEIIPNIIDDLDKGTLEVVTPADLWEMLKTVGVNMRYVQKIATHAQQSHVKELAITELVAKKIVNVIVNNLNYYDTIDIDVLDKISTNMLVQRLSQLLKVPIPVLETVDLKSVDPFKDIHFADFRIKSCKWYPSSIELLLKEARSLDELGSSKTDSFIKDKFERERATQILK